MAALVAAIHVFFAAKQDVDGRHKAGHDDSTRPKFALANAALVPGLDFFKGRRDRPSRFPSPPTRGMERREAPGACETPLGCLRGTPWRAFRYRLAGRARFATPCPGREPNDVGPCASRRSTAAKLAQTCARLTVSASARGAI